MSSKSESPEFEHGGRHRLAAAGLFGAAVLCCAGPGLVAAGALGVIGSWLADPWLSGAAVVLVAALVWVLRRRTPSGDGCGCGAPTPPESRRPVHIEPAPIQHPER